MTATCVPTTMQCPVLGQANQDDPAFNVGKPAARSACQGRPAPPASIVTLPLPALVKATRQ
ncbi:MAG TPA: hypothetical protein VFA16_05480, partial [Mycobacterium sp.]|uniref:hypothetical protein n=1 Tax=Mycobacterium sp. TaxID=1785 RepID=UPI002D228224